jgi:hypothetical protein
MKTIAMRVHVMSAGASLPEIAREAIQIAGRLNMPVVFAYDMADLVVSSSDCVEDVSRRYINGDYMLRTTPQ